MMGQKQNRRILQDKIYHYGVCFFTVLVIVPFFVFIAQLFYNGFTHLSANFFAEVSPLPIDAMMAYINGNPIPGGIANGIQGSFFILLLTLLIAVPPGFLVSVYIYRYSYEKYAQVVLTVCRLLGGIPSIIAGIVAYLLVVMTFHSHSALASAFALSICMFPLVVKTSIQSLERIPQSIIEAGTNIASYSKTFYRLMLPYIGRLLIADLLRITSYIMGLTAPLLMTSIGARMINWDVLSPTSSLPALLWGFVENPYLRDLMWATALLLLILVLVLNITANIISNDWKKKYT